MGFPCFSAIARSVMISAMQNIVITLAKLRFSAIARSVMISAPVPSSVRGGITKFQCYSS